MHKFHVRFTGANDTSSVDVTFKLEAKDYAQAEEHAWQKALLFFPPMPSAPKLEIRAIHIGQCEAGCL